MGNTLRDKEPISTTEANPFEGECAQKILFSCYTWCHVRGWIYSIISRIPCFTIANVFYDEGNKIRATSMSKLWIIRLTSMACAHKCFCGLIAFAHDVLVVNADFQNSPTQTKRLKKCNGADFDAENSSVRKKQCDLVILMGTGAVKVLTR